MTMDTGDFDWAISKDCTVCFCSWINCFYGYHCRFRQFHSFLDLPGGYSPFMYVTQHFCLTLPPPSFDYLISSMGLQIIWSFGLAFIDAYALIRKKVLHNHLIVSLFVVGDWVTATLSLAAASAAGGVTVLYFNDLGHCSFTEECQKYQMLGLSMYSLLISQISLKLISQSYGNFDFFILSTETMQEYSITTLKSYRLLSLPHMFYFFPSCLLACCKCNVGFFN
ncbi:CASP-like protein 5A1 isoform X2 [Mangifera indica]|uniref:CASP-like protein 5A1 isoform X2 n=1 Tax=Mangifera indica TaxID=29780 RepID=UPI001CFA3CEC|nr:CASP-like protein 5A1 isoform X2 [Mangifera indica]